MSFKFNMMLIVIYQQLPENKAPEGIAEAFIAAWSKYGKPEYDLVLILAEKLIYSNQTLN